MPHTASVSTMQPEPHQSTEWVTPEIAAEWLTHNVNNRNLRSALVNRYAHDMAHGDWRLTGETIKFSVSGRMIDGQHRCQGIVQAGVAVKMCVTRGLPDSAQQYVDQGASRSASDALNLSGHGQTTTLAAAARLGVLVDTGLLYKDRKQQNVSHAQILEWVQEHPFIEDAVQFAKQAPQKNSRISPAVLTYAFFRFAEIDVGAAEEFFVQLGTGANLEAGSPLLALSSRLYQLAMNGQKPGPRQLVALLFRAWNAYRSGRSMQRLPLVTKSDTHALPALK